MSEILTPPERRLRVTESHDAFARKLLKGGVMSVSHTNPDGTIKTNHITALDLTTVPPDATDQELIGWTGSMLHLTEQESAALTQSSAESVALYSRINLAYHDAVKHLRDELYFNYDETTTFGTPDIKSTADILRMFRGSYVFRQKKSTAVEKEQSLRFCDALSHTVAAFELQKSGAMNFINESKYVIDFLSSANGVYPPLFVSLNGKRSQNHLMILDSFAIAYNPAKHGQGAVSLRLDARGKGIARTHSKIVRDPQMRASEAQKDALGMRLVVDPQQGVAAAMQLLSRLFSEPFSASSAIIENDGFFTGGDSGAFREAISDNFKRNVQIIEEQKNSSSGGFTSLKIRVQITVPEGGNGQTVRRTLEVQIIPVQNAAETGARDHAVYELVQKVAEVTRTHKYVPLAQFSRYVQNVVLSFKDRNQHIQEADVLNWIQGRVAHVAGKGRKVMHTVHVGDTKRISAIPGLVNQEWVDAVLYAAGRDTNAVLLSSLRKMQKNSNGSSSQKVV